MMDIMKHYNINETRELLTSLGFTQDTEDIYKYYRDFTTRATVWIDILGDAWINVKIDSQWITIKKIYFTPEITDWRQLIMNLEERADLVFDAMA